MIDHQKPMNIFLFSKRKHYYYDIDSIRRTTKDGLGVANERDVWTLGTGNMRDKHYAQFPLEIPKRAIKAGTPQDGVCSACGACYKSNQCDCNGNVVPAVVLDPFAVSCTTGLAAAELGRNAIMIDLKDEYLQIGQERLSNSGYSKILEPTVYISR